MAFTDPQTITIDGAASTLNKVELQPTSTGYSTSDEALKLRISHQSTKGRTRSMARLDKRVIAADPLTASNEYKSLGVYLVVDRPEYGFTADAIDDVVQGFKTWLSTANVTKLVSNEH